MHVCARRCHQHVWQPADRLVVQSVAGGAQSAGTDVGEAAENIPSFVPVVDPSAAQPGTHTYTNSAAQMKAHSD